MGQVDYAPVHVHLSQCDQIENDLPRWSGWVIEQRGEDYWSFPLDGDEWTQGLHPAFTIEDVTMIF